MNVSAKDKSTGKTTNITIKSSGGLGDADIERMVNEAEAAKEDDQKKKAVIEIKNEADSMVYRTEQQLTEHGAKILDNIKEQVRNDISSLNEAIVSENEEQIREGVEKLKNSSMEIGKSIYSNEGDNQETRTKVKPSRSPRRKRRKRRLRTRTKRRNSEEVVSKHAVSGTERYSRYI